MSSLELIADRFQCEACGRVLKVSLEWINRKVKCRCGNSFLVDPKKFVAGSSESNTQKINTSNQVQGTNFGTSARLSDASVQRNGSQALRNNRLPQPKAEDVRNVEELQKVYQEIRQQVAKVVIGQKQVVEEVLIALFSQGHVLLVGVPGLAKTLLVSSIAKVLNLPFKRIQFTPDLMPSDITGTEVLQEDRTTGRRNFQFVQGPLFANLVLADEINRAPPKTQAALLEAMQERQVTVGETTFDLASPFLVMATQNPIEQEGTYALPEAQLDRFLLNIVVDYPAREDELQIIKQATSDFSPNLQGLLDAETIVKLQKTVRRIPVADHVIEFASQIVRSCRPSDPSAPDFVKEMIGWGAGPRAGIALIIAAKARAILHGRFHATTEDVRQVALPVLRHRVVPTFHAHASGVRKDEIITRVVREIEGPSS